MINHRTETLICFVICLLSALQCFPAISVIDDEGRQITVTQPVQRIISLAPHTTELLFAAGAGNKLVGTAKYSDYPAAARNIPRVGDTHSLDMERIISLNPDLIVIWQSGNGAGVMERIQDLHFRTYLSEPKTIASIAKSINDFGLLAGTYKIAKRSSEQFMNTLQKLRHRFAGRPAVSVFYQIWDQPLFTINGKHLISQALRICGGRNIFAELPALSPQVGLEAVLDRNPQVIIASGANADRFHWLDKWEKWPSLSAVKNRHLYFIPPDLIQRHTPRFLKGAAMLCKFLDRARE
ncbi:MAG: cobalamin-binding protein [Gammaproteobacteria bacterium]